jgi:tetratricopeptide (TPR) repeat protein
MDSRTKAEAKVDEQDEFVTLKEPSLDSGGTEKQLELEAVAQKEELKCSAPDQRRGPTANGQSLKRLDQPDQKSSKKSARPKRKGLDVESWLGLVVLGLVALTATFYFCVHKSVSENAVTSPTYCFPIVMAALGNSDLADSILLMSGGPFSPPDGQPDTACIDQIKNRLVKKYLQKDRLTINAALLAVMRTNQEDLNDMRQSTRSLMTSYPNAVLPHMVDVLLSTAQYDRASALAAIDNMLSLRATPDCGGVSEDSYYTLFCFAADMNKRLGAPEKTLQYLRQYPELQRDSAEACRCRATLYLDAGQPERALEERKKALAKETANDESRCQMAEIEMALGKYDQALSFTKQCCEAHANTIRAKAYLLLNRPNEALTAYNRCYSNDSQLKARILLKLGQYQQALEQLGPKGRNANLLFQYSDLPDRLLIKAEGLIAMRRYQEAIEACSRALVLNPNSDKAYEMRKKANLALGRVKDATVDDALLAKLTSTHRG